MRKAAAAPVVEDEGPSKAWLDSYADAMTLLLAFFVLLYAFSLLDEEKFAEFRYGVQQSFASPSPAVAEGPGFLDQGLGINDSSGLVAVMPESAHNTIEQIADDIAADQTVTPDEIEQLREAIETALAAATVDLDDFSVDLDPRGVVITLEERLLFASGSAGLGENSAPALSAVALVLADFDNQVLVDGHTDSVPTTGTAWPSNWELSSARATAVLRTLSEGFGLSGSRLSAVGHADTKPRAPNTTAEGRQQNRRTEIVVLVEPDRAEVSSTPIIGDLVASPADITGFDDPALSAS